MQVTGHGERVPRMNYNGHVLATKVIYLVGEHKLWFNPKRDGLRQVKTSKTRHIRSTSRNHSRIPRLWHTTAIYEGEWWIVGAPTTPSFRG